MSSFTVSGIGFDSHKFKKDGKLLLGGLEIPFEKGLKGHSDADVLCHAIADSILGACGEPDIGMLFPNTDQKNKGISSISILKEIFLRIKDKASLVYIDVVVICEEPKISAYVQEIKNNISSALGISSNRINIKGKTNEGMGHIGKGEGVAVISIATVERFFDGS